MREFALLWQKRLQNFPPPAPALWQVCSTRAVYSIPLSLGRFLLPLGITRAQKWQAVCADLGLTLVWVCRLGFKLTDALDRKRQAGQADSTFAQRAAVCYTVHRVHSPQVHSLARARTRARE